MGRETCVVSAQKLAQSAWNLPPSVLFSMATGDLPDSVFSINLGSWSEKDILQPTGLWTPSVNWKQIFISYNTETWRLFFSEHNLTSLADRVGGNFPRFSFGQWLFIFETLLKYLVLRIFCFVCLLPANCDRKSFLGFLQKTYSHLTLFQLSTYCVPLFGSWGVSLVAQW